MTSPRPPYRVIVGSTIWSLNGVNVFSMNLVRGLVERGVAAEILLTRHGSDDDKPLPLPDDVPFEILELGEDRSLPARWKALERYLEAHAPCIYIPNHDFDHSCVAPRLSRDVAIVGIIHSDDPEHYEHARCLGRYWNAVVTVSDAIAKSVIENDPSLRGRTATIPYGIDVPRGTPSRAGDSERPLQVVYAGRLDDHQKRVFDIPTIVARLEKARVDVRLTIVGGGGSLGARLEKMLKPAVERGSVAFAGILDNPDVLRIFERSDVLLLTSAFEGLPLTLLEAMARGCIPVVSDIRSGIPELVRDGHNGYRVRVGDTAGFAERLGILARSPAQRRELSAAAHTTIARGPYQLDIMVDRYLDLFDDVWGAVRSGSFVRPSGTVRPIVRPRRTWRSHVVPRLRVLAFYGRRLLGAF